MHSPIDEPTKEERETTLAQLRSALLPRPSPVPEFELSRLAQVAASDTGQSQVARHFLFWLAGEKDPTGFEGQGGLELRRLDTDLRRAAITVLAWWSGSTRDDEPLYLVLDHLREIIHPKS